MRKQIPKVEFNFTYLTPKSIDMLGSKKGIAILQLYYYCLLLGYRD